MQLHRIIIIIAIILLVSGYYFYSPVCEFNRVGSHYTAADDCNTCLCTITGRTCTEIACPDDNADTVIRDLQESCSWQPGNCERFCSYTEDRYFFNLQTNTCETWQPEGCCTDPPFEHKDECQLICEKA